jgi:nicotinate phosphoribosyltransferase
VQAGQVFGIPVSGTHAHSWVMAFPTELEAFRAYAEVFPDATILLVDTYDTLTSGIPNALRVARELRSRGHELQGIRLDSGDLAYLSRQARSIFDAAGFPAVRIVASNELDEHVISAIRHDGGQIDVYGVGTELVTGGGAGGGALGGVYKLVSFAGQPRMKVTSDITKASLPGVKMLLRLIDDDGRFLQDVICTAGERLTPGATVYDPLNPSRRKSIPACRMENLRSVVMDAGKIVTVLPGLEQSADHCAQQLKQLPEGTLRLHNPHSYKVSISPGLHRLREDLLLHYPH